MCGRGAGTRARGQSSRSSPNASLHQSADRHSPSCGPQPSSLPYCSPPRRSASSLLPQVAAPAGPLPPHHPSHLAYRLLRQSLPGASCTATTTTVRALRPAPSLACLPPPPSRRAVCCMATTTTTRATRMGPRLNRRMPKEGSVSSTSATRAYLCLALATLRGATDVLCEWKRC